MSGLYKFRSAKFCASSKSARFLNPFVLILQRTRKNRQQLYTMSVAVESMVSRMSVPRPIHFSHAEQPFCPKKRRLHFSSPSPSNSSPARLSHSVPPLPPSKGCPSMSRMFPRPPSPWTPLSYSLRKSPPPNSVYDPSKQESYFSQCFTNLGLLGRGSFGEVYKVSKIKICVYMCVCPISLHEELNQC